MPLIIKLHLLTILPVIFLGPFILFRKKGDKVHKALGKVWASCMLVSCLLSFGITSNGLSWLHGLSAFTIYAVFKGVIDAKNGRIMSHKKRMIYPYVGVIIAMFFAFSGEGRLLNKWLLAIIA